MNFFVKRQLYVIGFLTLFLISACGLQVDLPISNPIAPAVTADTDEITTAVLAEVDNALARQSEEQEALVRAQVAEQVAAALDEVGQASAAELDTGSIVDAVLEEVQQDLTDVEQPVPVIFGDEEARMAVANLEAAMVNLYRQTNPSVVFIIVPQLGSGSGFVYDESGHIVTNNHVVEGGQEYEVVFANGERYPAKLVGTDVDSDLAVIKVDQLPEGVKPLNVDEDNPEVGQFVVAIGNPFGEQGSMSMGIISGLNRSLFSERETETNSTYTLPEVVQTDAPINPGNSGGPLLNLNGEVVGVNSAIRTTTGINSGVSFSIPARAVAKIVPSLIESGEHQYSYMGVTFDGEISLDDRTAYGLSQTQGAYVLAIGEGSPAEAAGLIPANPRTGRGGDLVVALDGQQINDFSDLNSYLVYESDVGQTIVVTVLRNGQPVDIELTLGSRP